MIKPRILVTSAAGRTGSAAVFQLLEKGFPVRALVRRDDHRSAKLRQAGAEVIIGNQLDFRDLQKALVDVKRAWHIAPFAPNLLHGASLFALAAEEAKLEVVALMSGWNPHATHPSVATREHWVSNNIYQWMPSVDVIYVNPGLFAFVYLLGLPLVSQLGMLALPYGDGRNAPPSNEDIARVAVSVLENPESHTGKSYRPTGPKLIDGHEIATILSRILGRKVRYQHVSTEMFIRVAAAQGTCPIWSSGNKNISIPYCKIHYSRQIVLHGALQRRTIVFIFSIKQLNKFLN